MLKEKSDLSRFLWLFWNFAIFGTLRALSACQWFGIISWLFSYLYYQYLCTRFYYVFDINEIIYIALYFICFQTSDDSSSELNLFKMALREAYNRELEFYETQEAQIMKQIAALENDRSHLRERKRSHIQCLVNVIACYRKK